MTLKNFSRQRVQRARGRAQTTVMVVLALGVILVFLGLALDSGLLYFAKARLARAADAAALAAVGNFNPTVPPEDTSPYPKQRIVAGIMIKFSKANFTDLEPDPVNHPLIISNPVAYNETPTPGNPTYCVVKAIGSEPIDPNLPPDPKGPRRYVKVTLFTGTTGQTTSAVCSLRSWVRTFFIGVFLPSYRYVTVSAEATAKRNPKLIMIVVDRSGSMLNNHDANGSTTDANGNLVQGGALGLPQAINLFMNIFDPAYDTIGMVSFSSNARLEIAPTKNFLKAGLSNLFHTYDLNEKTGYYVPGQDDEQTAGSVANPANNQFAYDPNYFTTGIRRLKFGGATAADEGMRLAMEQLMANSGFTNPDVSKYLVLFTDGDWNTARTLWAAPGYTNIIQGLPPESLGIVKHVPSSIFSPNPLMPPGVNLTNEVTLPSFAPYETYYRAYQNISPAALTNFQKDDHSNDQFQSWDGTIEGGQVGKTVGTDKTGSQVNFYAEFPKTKPDPFGPTYYNNQIDVWLQPGAVDFDMRTNSFGTKYTNVYVSNYLWPTNCVNAISVNIGPLVPAGNPKEDGILPMQPMQTNILQVPGYIIDGIGYDGLDIRFPHDNIYPFFRSDNFLTYFSWPDENLPKSVGSSHTPTAATIMANSNERRLMFRNYPNLLTGFTLYRPDDPSSTTKNHVYRPPPSDVLPDTVTTVEPLQPTESMPNGYPRRLYGLGYYYPSAGFYWPFNYVGLSSWPENMLRQNGGNNGLSNIDASGNDYSRFADYSINMLNDEAIPTWSGELFYGSSKGVTVNSDLTGISSMVTSATTWQTGLPTYASILKNNMVTPPVSNLNLHPIDDTSAPNDTTASPQVWRPGTFRGNILTPKQLGLGAEITSDSLGTKYEKVRKMNENGTGYVCVVSGYYTNVYSTDPYVPSTYSDVDSSGNTLRTVHYWTNDNNSKIKLGDTSISKTGGWTSDGINFYANCYAWSGRPTHYYDLTTSKWKPVPSNQVSATGNGNIGLTLPLGQWKVLEYAYHARKLGVTIYTVGYGTAVSKDEQDLLARIANSKTTTSGHTELPYVFNPAMDSSRTYIPSQPVGIQTYAQTPADIQKAFSIIGSAISGYLNN